MTFEQLCDKQGCTWEERRQLWRFLLFIRFTKAMDLYR